MSTPKTGNTKERTTAMMKVTGLYLATALIMGWLFFINFRAPEVGEENVAKKLEEYQTNYENLDTLFGSLEQLALNVTADEKFASVNADAETLGRVKGSIVDIAAGKYAATEEQEITLNLHKLIQAALQKIEGYQEAQRKEEITQELEAEAKGEIQKSKEEKKKLEEEKKQLEEKLQQKDAEELTETKTELETAQAQIDAKDQQIAKLKQDLTLLIGAVGDLKNGVDAKGSILGEELRRTKHENAFNSYKSELKNDVQTIADELRRILDGF